MFRTDFITNSNASPELMQLAVEQLAFLLLACENHITMKENLTMHS
jgi:hypothetical protein